MQSQHELICAKQCPFQHTCPSCGRVFASQQAMVDHALGKAICTRALDKSVLNDFKEGTGLKKKQNSTTTVSPIQCPLQQVVNKIPKQARLAVDPTTCPSCARVFASRQAMVRHALDKACCTRALDKSVLNDFKEGYGLTVNRKQNSTTTVSQCPLQQVVNKIPKQARWAVQEWSFRNIDDNGQSLAQAIQSDTGVLAISDGSFKGTIGTACFTIEGPNSLGAIVCPSVVPIDRLNQGSYLSELGGIFGIVVFIDIIVQVHNIKKGTVIVGSDALSVLQTFMECTSNVGPPSKSQSSDLLSAIREWKNKSPIQWKVQHIKGHQNNSRERLAMLNCEVDKRATERRIGQERCTKCARKDSAKRSKTLLLH